MLRKSLMENLSIIFFLKIEIKTYSDEATDFNDNEMSKADSNHTCLAVVSLDPVLKKDVKNYYPKYFLKKYNYTEKEKKVITHIADDLVSSSNDSDESDEE